MFPSSAVFALLALAKCILSLEGALDLCNINFEHRKPTPVAPFSLHGAFDEYGRDSGVPNIMKKDNYGLWQYDLMTELPSFSQVYIPGPYEDPESDMSPAIGEFRNFTVAGHLSLVSPRGNIVNVDRYPGSPALAYRIILNETDLGYYLSPIGSRRIHVVIYFLGTVPILTGFASIRIYQCAFYAVKVTKGQYTSYDSTLKISAKRFSSWDSFGEFQKSY